jgi:cytochrome b
MTNAGAPAAAEWKTGAMAKRDDSAAGAGLQAVVVWDWPVRIVHWILVVLIAVSYVTSEIGGNAMTYHMWSGYAILALIVFRILWGFFGSHHARFTSFVAGPAAIGRYVGDMVRGRAAVFLGHNPLGALSVLALLLAIAVQAVTGLFANDEIFTEGPLASRVSGDTSSLLTTIHRYNFYVVLALIALHIAAVLFYLLVKRDNLIAPMLTGRKRVAAELASAVPPVASLWLALALFAVVAAAVATVVNWS